MATPGSRLEEGQETPPHPAAWLQHNSVVTPAMLQAPSFHNANVWLDRGGIMA